MILIIYLLLSAPKVECEVCVAAAVHVAEQYCKFVTDCFSYMK